MKTNKKRQTLHAALLAACALTAVAFPVNNAFASVRFDGDTLYLNPYWSLNTEGKAVEHDMLYGNGTYILTLRQAIRKSFRSLRI